jgi:Cytochrome P460
MASKWGIGLMNQKILVSSAAALSVFAVVFSAGLQSSAGPQSISSSPEPAGAVGKYVDKDGTIHLPEDYRLKWIHLGSWYVEGKNGEAGDLHDVYAEPEAVAAFRGTGKWPAGATIVKEIRASQNGKLTTGNVHWDGQIKQWFVMVKDNDTHRTFPENPNWGLGWGWALYTIDNPKKNISTNYKIDCMGCHIPAQQTDWVFTRGYPSLIEKEGPFKKYPKETYEGK